MMTRHQRMLMDRLEAYRHGDHVIMIIRKNASNYLLKNLELWGGWDQCKTSDIDWAKDRVTGVMQNPLRRWTKGMAEELCLSPRLLAWATEDDTEFFKVFADHIGAHTSPVTLHLGDRAGCVQWMLKDHPSITLERQLCLWLREQGSDHRPIAKKIHQSDLKKIEIHRMVERQVKRLAYDKTMTQTQESIKKTKITKNNQPINYHLLLAQDMALYNRLRNSINPRADSWDQLYDKTMIQDETI